MKVDRRKFLSFVVGGAAGTALSPLPWKLVDDSSIWSQNWPWTPVPEDGEVSYEPTTCSLCPGGCGIIVRKIKDRVVKIEGIKGHPVNDGGICILGLAGLQLLYGPTRVKTPLKREGARGSGKWRKISWADAISEVAGQLNSLRSSDKADTIGCIGGSDRGVTPNLLKRLTSACGSNNFFRTPSMQDSYETALQLMHGKKAMAGFDFENADFILSFGSGILDGWGSPVRMFKANSNWKTNKTPVIQIEPRLSNTAAKADQWLPVNPGTEADLAFSLINIIIEKGLYDSNFVNNYSLGFADLKQLVKDKYKPAKIAQATGLKSSDIEKLALKFADARRPLAICGSGQGHTPGSLKTFVAVHALNALTGRVNSKGGVWAVEEPDYIKWPEVQKDKPAVKGLAQARIDGAKSKYPLSQYLLNQLPDAVNSESKASLQALLIADANPFYTMPDNKAAQEAFNKIPFIVSFSSYMDETATNADLILPNHIYLERFEDIPTATGFAGPFIGLSRPIVKPQFNTQALGDSLISIVRTMGGTVAASFPWADYKTCLVQTLGSKWPALSKKGYWVDSRFMVPGWTEGFKTASQKFNFSNKDLMMVYNSRPIIPEGSDSFPLLLLPYDSIRLANGYIGDPPFVIKTVADTVLKGKKSFVEINPITAKKYKLKQGSTAILSTPKGQAQVKVHLFEGLMPGLIAMPRGLGHTAYDNYLAGKGINFNELIGTQADPVSGQDAAWGIKAKIARA